jgi:hypothetical protein
VCNKQNCPLLGPTNIRAHLSLVWCCEAFAGSSVSSRRRKVTFNGRGRALMVLITPATLSMSGSSSMAAIWSPALCHRWVRREGVKV